MNRIARRIRRPATGCSTTASIRLVRLSGLVGGVTAAGDDPVGLPLQRAQLGGSKAAASVGVSTPPEVSGRERVEVMQQLGGAALADRNRRRDGDAEFRREAVEINRDAAVARKVEHVENQQHRPADAFQLQDKAKAEAKIGRVRNADDAVGRRFVLQAAENHVARDFLVRTAAPERIGAGQVDDRDAAARPASRRRPICARRSRPDNWRSAAGCR